MKEEINKKIKQIVERLFDDGKRYGEEINYTKDEVLYEIKISAIDEAVYQITELLKNYSS